MHHPNRLPGEKINPVASVPFVLMHLVPLAVIFTGVTWQSVQILLVTYWVRMFFITAGYHRYFAHRTFKTSRPVQFLLALGGTTATQKGPLWWAGHHRLHHRHTDTVADVHSPIKGVWYSHVGWILTDATSPTPEDAIADFARVPELRWLNRFDWVGPVALAVACAVWGGWSGLVVGYFLSTVLLWHSTFLVNSMAHLWGTRRYATRDSSRNNPLVALLTLGEGWHNNHHHMPTSARQGVRWWEIDVTYYVLRGLAALRVVRDLKVHHPKLCDTARLDRGAYDIGMFRFHWDKATTRVAVARERDDLDDLRVVLSTRADESLEAAERLGEESRTPRRTTVDV